MSIVMEIQWLLRSAFSVLEWKAALPLHSLTNFSPADHYSVCLDHDVVSRSDPENVAEFDLDDFFYGSRQYLTISESLMLYACFVVSLLSFIYATILLLESLVEFGLVRCHRKLKAWKRFMVSKLCRL